MNRVLILSTLLALVVGPLAMPSSVQSAEPQPRLASQFISAPAALSHNFDAPSYSFPVLDVGRVPGRPRFEPYPAERRPVNAFDTLSSPRRLGPTTTAETVAQNSPDQTPRMVAVFPDAARFTWPTAWNDPTPRATAVIYEGMRVQVDENGAYETSFVIEAPRSALVLRLQLSILERVEGRDFPRGQITLPPIVIEPELSSSRHQPSHSYVVRRTGYSHLLTGISKDEIRDFRITRSGTADFGSLPAP